MIDENCGVGAWKLFQTFTYFSSESPLQVLFYRNAVLALQWWKELPTNVRTTESLAIFCEWLKTHFYKLQLDHSMTPLQLWTKASAKSPKCKCKWMPWAHSQWQWQWHWDIHKHDANLFFQAWNRSLYEHVFNITFLEHHWYDFKKLS